MKNLPSQKSIKHQEITAIKNALSLFDGRLEPFYLDYYPQRMTQINPKSITHIGLKMPQAKKISGKHFNQQ